MALAKNDKYWQSTRRQLVTTSSSMKSLARTSWGGGGSEAIDRAEQLRISTVNVGKSYFSDTLPNTVGMAMVTKSLFELTGLLLDIDEFLEIVPLILELAIPLWQDALAKNEEMMTSMKQATDESRRTILQLECEERNYERVASQLRAKAETKKKWGIALSLLLPIVGLVPAYFFWKSADGNRSEARQQTALARRHAITSRNVAQELIPVAESCDSFGKSVAGLLKVYQAEFQQMKTNGVRGYKRHHIIKMKKRAVEVADVCEKFGRELNPDFIKSLSF